MTLADRLTYLLVGLALAAVGTLGGLLHARRPMSQWRKCDLCATGRPTPAGRCMRCIRGARVAALGTEWDWIAVMVLALMLMVAGVYALRAIVERS